MKPLAFTVGNVLLSGRDEKSLVIAMPFVVVGAHDAPGSRDPAEARAVEKQLTPLLLGAEDPYRHVRAHAMQELYAGMHAQVSGPTVNEVRYTGTQEIVVAPELED